MGEPMIVVHFDDRTGECSTQIHKDGPAENAEFWGTIMAMLIRHIGFSHRNLMAESDLEPYMKEILRQTNKIFPNAPQPKEKTNLILPA